MPASRSRDSLSWIRITIVALLVAGITLPGEAFAQQRAVSETKKIERLAERLRNVTDRRRQRRLKLRKKQKRYRRVHPASTRDAPPVEVVQASAEPATLAEPPALPPPPLQPPPATLEPTPLAPPSPPLEPTTPSEPTPLAPLSPPPEPTTPSEPTPLAPAAASQVPVALAPSQALESVSHNTPRRATERATESQPGPAAQRPESMAEPEPAPSQPETPGPPRIVRIEEPESAVETPAETPTDAVRIARAELPATLDEKASVDQSSSVIERGILYFGIGFGLGRSDMIEQSFAKNGAGALGLRFGLILADQVLLGVHGVLIGQYNDYRAEGEIAGVIASGMGELTIFPVPSLAWSLSGGAGWSYARTVSRTAAIESLFDTGLTWMAATGYDFLAGPGFNLGLQVRYQGTELELMSSARTAYACLWLNWY